AVTVLMLASLGTFFASSRAEMTARAIGSVPVDWQVLVTSGADPGRVTRTVANSPGVMEALPVEYADSTGLASKTGATVHTTGAGRVLGIPDGYAATFPGEIRPLVGADHGVLLAQQTAANLGAGVGSSVAIHRPGQEPVTVNVDGVVDLPAADSLFQSIGVIAGAAPTAPPDNVVLLPAATWQRMFAHAAAGTATTEVHVSLCHDLPTDPASAFGQIVGR